MLVIDRLNKLKNIFSKIDWTCWILLLLAVMLSEIKWPFWSDLCYLACLFIQNLCVSLLLFIWATYFDLEFGMTKFNSETNQFEFHAWCIYWELWGSCVVWFVVGMQIINNASFSYFLPLYFSHCFPIDGVHWIFVTLEPGKNDASGLS